VPEEVRDRFEHLVAALRTHAEIIVLAAHAGLPVSANAERRVAEVLGVALADSVVSLYRQANGLQLRWIRRDNPRFDEARHHFVPGPFDPLLPWNTATPEDGLINLLPLEMCFLSDWKDFTWSGQETGREIFLGVEYDRLDLRRSIRPFDVFSGSCAMVFVSADGDPNPKLVLGDDHIADITSSKITDAASYFEFLIASRGEVAARYRAYADAFGAAAHPQRRLVTDASYWAEHPPHTKANARPAKGRRRIDSGSSGGSPASERW
jgi:hypothetical protein